MNQPLASTTPSRPAGLPGNDQWLARFSTNRIPVLSRTREAIELLREEERDTLPLLCKEISRDAGFTLHLVQHTNKQLKERNQAPAETLQHAALLLGVPFIHQITGELDLLEDLDDEKTRNGLAQHYQNTLFLRHFMDVCLPRTLRGQRDEFALASMLYGAIETHLWLTEPDLALAIEDNQQQKLEGLDLAGLHDSYASRTGLPELNQADPGGNNRHAILQTCARISRVATRSWSLEPMMPELEVLSGLLEKPVENLLLELKHAAIASARELRIPGAYTAAMRLPQYPGPKVTTVKKPVPAKTQPAPTPKDNDHKLIYRECLEKLQAACNGSGLSAHEVISSGMKALHEGLKLPRVSFVMMNRDRTVMQSKYLLNASGVPALETIRLDMSGKHLFSKLMTTPQCLWLNDKNRQKYWPHLPADFREHIAARSFLAMSIFIDDKPIGMFYADSHGQAVSLTDKHQVYFKQVCQLVGKALASKKGGS